MGTGVAVRPYWRREWRTGCGMFAASDIVPTEDYEEDEGGRRYRERHENAQGLHFWPDGDGN
jgi:hypothetical protein